MTAKRRETEGIGWAWQRRDGTFAYESLIYAEPPNDKQADGGWVRVRFTPETPVVRPRKAKR